jgi:GNAT superfamily N-acetyltransferase
MPASQPEPSIRPPRPIALRADHLPEAVELSRNLNWPYRLEDWTFAHTLGRGFAVECEGRLAGAALWWSYGAGHGSAGMIIVAPYAQRRGIGLALMEALLADSADRTLLLNSTAEGLKLYERLGFVATGQVRQHQGVLLAAPQAEPGVGMRDLRTGDRAAIQGLDRRATGMDRLALIDALLAVASVKVVERGGEVSGYACARRWGRGVVIGPLVARDARDARALTASLAAAQAGRFVRMDVAAATGMSPWLEAIGLPPVDEVVAMVRGDAPQADPGVRLFALANQSFG